MKDVTLVQDEETILICEIRDEALEAAARPRNERVDPSPSPCAQRCISVRALKDPRRTLDLSPTRPLLADIGKLRWANSPERAAFGPW
jgi:hypothetical protein